MSDVTITIGDGEAAAIQVAYLLGFRHGKKQTPITDKNEVLPAVIAEFRRMAAK